MKKVLFTITSLGAGGAEKVLVDLVANLDRSKYEIHVFSIYNDGIYISEIMKYAKYHYGITLKNKKNFFTKLINRIKVAFVRHVPAKLLYTIFLSRGKYDIEISFLEGWSTKLIAASMNKSKKYAWVHTDMIQNPHADYAYKNRAKHLKAYKKYNKIIFVSQEAKEKFVEKFPEITQELLVCNNPIDINKIKILCKEPVSNEWDNTKINIVAVGRLVKVKGFERLINACNDISKDSIEFCLNIIGDGELRNELEKCAKPLIQDGLCRFWGYQSNPYKFIEHADICVSSSYTEGAGVFICEALALNKLVLATKCPGSVSMLKNGTYGVICDNSEKGIYLSLKNVLLNYKKLKDHFNLYYPENVREYRADYVANKISKILLEDD